MEFHASGTQIVCRPIVNRETMSATQKVKIHKNCYLTWSQYIFDKKRVKLITVISVF